MIVIKIEQKFKINLYRRGTDSNLDIMIREVLYDAEVAYLVERGMTRSNYTFSMILGRILSVLHFTLNNDLISILLNNCVFDDLSTEPVPDFTDIPLPR